MNNMFDSTFNELLQWFTDEHHLGVILVAQMGMTPEEIQLVIQTAEYVEAEQALITKKAYLMRCLGVQKHQLSLGAFGRIAHTEDHPLLWNFNYPYQQIYFNGTPNNVDELMIELNQLYGQHYGQHHGLVDDVNRSRPLGSILSAGYGLLGEMPQPMAEKVKALLAKHGLQVDFVESEIEAPPIPLRLLVLDDSYFVATLFSVDPMQGKNPTDAA